MFTTKKRLTNSLALFYGIILDTFNSIMKQFNFLVIIFLIIMGITPKQLKAQAELFNPIKEAIKAGNAKEAVKFFSSSVDINLEGTINTHNKVQAEFVLRDFLKKHVATEFNIVHTGSSKGGLQYAIGRYICVGEGFIVTIRMREVANVYLVNEISFIKE